MATPIALLLRPLPPRGGGACNIWEVALGLTPSPP